MYDIVFEYEDLGLCFNICLPRRVTILGGSSASGKTLFFNSLKKIIRLIKFGEYRSSKFPNPKVNEGKVIVIDHHNVLEIPKVLSGDYNNYIICIDSADYILACYPDLAEYISTDYSNFYIIAARGQLNLDYDTSNEVVLEFSDRTFTLKPALEEVINDLYNI